MSKETVEEVKVISPGAMLKAAREKQGLSREEVADQLHLRFTIIKDLEEDQYATDISATFTKGYLKLYSKLLGIDEEQVLSAYQQLGTQEKEPAKLQSFSQKVARQASDQRLMWVTYFVLILVLAGVIAWWIQQDDTSLSNFIDRNVSAATQNNEATNSAANSTAANNSAVNNPAVNTPATNNDQQSATVPADTTASQSSAFPPANTSTSDTSSDLGAQQAEATNDNAQNSDQANVPADTQPADTQVSSQPANNSSDSSPDEAQSGSQSNTQSNTQSTTSPALETEAGVFATLETDSGQADDLSGQSSSQTEEPSSQTASSELAAQNDNVNQIPSDAEPALNLPLGDPVELVFTFSGDCWMKLTDATGEDVAYGIKQAGRIMPVSGVPPFEVVLGAPESVQISYAGEPIDMARFRPGYTARFQLPLSE